MTFYIDKKSDVEACRHDMILILLTGTPNQKHKKRINGKKKYQNFGDFCMELILSRIDITDKQHKMDGKLRGTMDAPIWQPWQDRYFLFTIPCQGMVSAAMAYLWALI